MLQHDIIFISCMVKKGLLITCIKHGLMIQLISNVLNIWQYIEEDQYQL